MAIVTHSLANGTDADGAMWLVEYMYESITRELLTIRCNNAQSAIARDVTATSTADRADTFTFNFAAGQDQTRNVPPGQINKMHLTVTPSGKLDGVEWSIA